mmetsp:Transcript_12375/g.25185  ORF Transcript_12375/g.25185 Transcript_12375/m.25185 type:complete len:203 (-) Transcript_12375:156-764(-)
MIAATMRRQPDSMAPIHARIVQLGPIVLVSASSQPAYVVDSCGSSSPMRYTPKMPTVMSSWFMDTRAPRYASGEISAMYSGTMTDDIPTPTPASARETMAWAGSVVKASHTHPETNGPADAARAMRRPTASAREPVNMAPPTAPMLTMDEKRDPSGELTEESWHCFGSKMFLSFCPYIAGSAGLVNPRVYPNMKAPSPHRIA